MPVGHRVMPHGPGRASRQLPACGPGRDGGAPAPAGSDARSPAERVDQPGLRRAAGPAVAPRDDGQRRRRRPALRAVDRLARSVAGLGELAGPLLVDGLVAPAGAPEMGFGAASTVCGDGASSSRVDATLRRPPRRPSRAVRGAAGTAADPQDRPAGRSRVGRAPGGLAVARLRSPASENRTSAIRGSPEGRGIRTVRA
jgi:hypothetical protein